MGINIITTMGTSLLSNVNRANRFEFGKDLTQIPHHVISEFMKQKRKEKREYEISAEINSTLQIIEKLRREKKQVRTIHFILSETPETRKELLYFKQFFGEFGIQVKETIIYGLKYTENQFKLSGLRSLVTQLTEIIDHYKNTSTEVVMNVTGGFKAETAYATVLAQLRRVRVFYIYETFNEIVELPYLPLSLDVDYWNHYEYAFELFDKGVTNEKKESFLCRLPHGFRYLIFLDPLEAKWFLNPAGETFYLSYLSEKEVYLQTIDQKKVFKKNRETTLWDKTRNVHINTLTDIPDAKVKSVLRRVLKFSFVKKIELVDYHRVGSGRGETYLKFKRKVSNQPSHYVQYQIHCVDGVQNINILVERGFCDELVFMLGKKVYP